MTMPNFLIVGAARSGTTALYQYLRQHPQVYMCPVKEPGFFAFEGEEPGSGEPEHDRTKRSIRRPASALRITDVDTYRALFQDVSDEAAIGEASPVYLIYPRAAQRVRHYIPEAKLIAILRDPVERAYSAYVMKGLHVGGGRGAFGQAARNIYWGFYYTHLIRYFDIFDPAQIRVYLYEDFRADPVGILRDVFCFLGVSETFEPDLSIEYNVSGIPRNRVWHALLRGSRPMKSILRPLIPSTLRQRSTYYLGKLQRKGLTKPPPLELDVRAELIQVYREDILKLQKLLQRNLSAWLE
jgi:hypothetical protein